jgi:hypothetical protein
VRKHLAQAVVLMRESRTGYPTHRWLAIAHLEEASAEAEAEYPYFASQLWAERKNLESEDTDADLYDLLHQFDQSIRAEDT